MTNSGNFYPTSPNNGEDEGDNSEQAPVQSKITEALGADALGAAMNTDATPEDQERERQAMVAEIFDQLANLRVKTKAAVLLP